MLVRFARNAPGMTPKEAYKVPAHRLISGEMGSADAMAYQPTAHGAFDAHEAESELGMVNAFASYQRFQASTPEAVSLPPYASKNSSPKGAPLLSHHEISENHLSPVPPSVVRHYSDRSGASSPDLTARLYDNRSKGNSPAPSDRRYDRSGANTPELPVNATYGDVRCEGGSSL